MAKPKITPIEVPQGRKLSFTGIKEFEKSPRHYIHYLNTPKVDTEAMTKGNALHCLVLNPEEWDDKFIVYEKFDRRSNDAKALWAQLLESAKGDESKKIKRKLLITKEDVQIAQDMAERIFANPESNDLIQQLTYTEKHFEYIHHKTKIPIKGFIDGGRTEKDNDDFMLDVKTDREGDPKSFHRDIFNMGYEKQAVMYLLDYFLKNGRHLNRYFWVVVENTAPYSISVHRATDDVLKYGQQKVDLLLQKFAICCKENLWDRDYDFHSLLGKFNVELPYYLKNQLSE